MGQPHVLVSLDKREFVWLGRGVWPTDPPKLTEMLAAGNLGEGGALVALLAVSSRGNHGDLAGSSREHPVVGRWAGDRVAIVGEYTEREDLPEEHEADLVYELCVRPNSPARSDPERFRRELDEKGPYRGTADIRVK